MAKKVNKQEASIQELIDNTAEKTVAKVIKELKKQRLLKDNQLDSYQKTEQVLYNYNNFKAAIKDKKEQIKEISAVGLKSKSKDISFYHSGGFTEEDSIVEKIDLKIQSIKESISLTEKYINIIDTALEKIKEDKYFDLVILKYFENKTVQEIAEYFNVDDSTINRNKRRLINKLKITLFSDEAIQEMLS